MAKKTIYISDEQLWERARALAGPDGLSGFLAEALRVHVEATERAHQGFRAYHFSCYGESFQFEGRFLDSLTTTGEPKERLDVYLTKGRSLLVTVTTEGDDEINYYCGRDSVQALREFLLEALPGQVSTPNAEEFARGITQKLGPEWSVRIE